MKILCLETSSNLCSVAILEDTKTIDKIELNNGLTHSETLMPLIQKILEKNNLTLKDINLIAVDIGPGSFTGLRIGIATAKAFADSMNIPCVGVSSLEILAYNISNPGYICSTIDCKNDNCYFSIFKLENNKYKLIEQPQTLSITEVNNILNEKYKNEQIYHVGNGLFKQNENNYLNTSNLGIAAYNKYYNNEFSNDVSPMYLKKPQAQIQLEQKLNQSK